MELKIDNEPQVDSLEFFTRKQNYVQAASPRNIVRQRGLEFDHYRQYMSGDDATLIDWKASARVNELLVRVYAEDVSLNILVILDVSESMLYGTQAKGKIEYAAELALNISYGALSYGDRIALALFNDKIVQSLPFRAGLEQYGEIVSLLCHPPGLGGKVDIENVLNNLIELYRDTHLVILISDFICLGENFLEDIQAVFDQFDILGMIVNDPTDISLKDSHFLMHIDDPYTNDSAYIKPAKVEKNYRSENEERIRSLKDFFLQADKEVWSFMTNEEIGPKLIRLLDERNSLRK